jgi:hypothetical protein
MTKPVLKLIGCFSIVVPFVTASAQTAIEGLDRLAQEPSGTSPNRINLSYRMGFNLNVKFKNLGAFPPASNPGPATGGTEDRYYDDGFNLRDSTDNNHGPGFENTTWAWGVNDTASQMLPSSVDPQTVVMHSVSSPGTSASEDSRDPLPGMELTYDRELLRKDHWRLGTEIALGYTYMSVSDHSPLPVGIQQLTDSYSVPPGVVTQPFPPGGYAHGRNPVGIYNPVIGSVPSRTLNLLQNEVAGSRHFSADMVDLHLGPSFEFSLGKKVTAGLSGGFALVYVNSDFSYDDSISGFLSKSGSGSHSDWLPGGYVAGNISVALSDRWALTAGAQFEDVGHYSQVVDGRKATLDLTQAIFVTLGITYSF